MSLDGEKDSKNSSMVDINSIIEGTVKFRDGKKWKSRWCVMRKLSPVADCLHLQFYKDSKERYKNGPTKASLSLEHFLGIESGFTLDKESNTIAIICQDVIVILAFDTREILMQWQVKISCNLGDDIQYLVLVASAATKIKIPPGPARLHIQNHRFCITTGIPPRLSGLWSLAHLRRYGVVDNRFCFEGGSSSGKCEGFVVLITDYGEEISNCFKLASQGKLNSNNRYTKPIDSPRKMKDNQSMKCDCSSSSFWPSQESRGLESFIGCDSSSILDDIDSNDDVSHFSRKRLMAMERCMSCSSKRSLVPTMSRSSTITESNQEICFGSSSYRSTTSIDTHHQRICGSKPALDRISMKSQESCGNFSEYSIPRQFPFHPGHSHEASSVRSFSVPRHEPTKSFVGSYDNYDSPKILSPSSENYDKPKSVKMYLEQNAGGRHTIFNGDHGNYDMPNIHCCANGQNRLMNDDMKTDCTCHRVMSWADNWMPCRRGTGIENTGIPVSILVPNTPTPTSQKVIAQEPAKCKLNDFSNTDKNGLYALVDPAKKQPKRLNEEQSTTASFPRAQSQTPSANYANLDFANSLEIYENSREVLKREKALTSNDNNNKICSNGNAKENLLNHNKENENYLVMDVNERSKTFPGYISMHPKNSVKPKTSVVVEEQIEEVATLPPRPNNKLISSKILLNLDEKSHSNPDLNRPSLNLDEKQEASSTTKLVFKKSSSVDSFRFIENESSSIVEDETSTSTSTYQDTTKADSIIINKTKSNGNIKNVNVRYAENGSKQPNRDSSSSNDSGVSTASTIIPKLYNEFELPLINQIKKRRQLNQTKSCVHASLIRRSKSFDPFGDLSFQFATRKAIGNGHSIVQNKAGKCPSLGAIMTSHIDSNSTSSGTSDMSDYIETLSLSSSSSDAEALKNKNNGTHMINTMRPRSGKEYEKIDRAAISGLVQASSHTNSISPISSSTTSSSNPNYVNITPVPENSESPSPGYQSSSSFQEEFAVIKEPDVVVE